MIVSFIIVAYNAEKVLENTLSCLKKQDYNHKKIEVILVDSNSTDKTKKIMNDFSKKSTDFKKVYVLDNPKKTLPCGWNVALKVVSGDAILRVDAHTNFPSNFISENVKEIESGENIVGGKCRSITMHDSWKEKMLLTAEESIFGAGIAGFRRKQTREYVSTLAFAMYRKEVFETVGKYNENLARTEDNEMHYRMREKGYKFLLSPNIETVRYARSNLKDMIKQKYGNGKWIGITMYYSPKCFSIYHFVPLLFVLALIGSLLLLAFKIPFTIIALLSAYALFNILNILIITLNNGFKLYYLLLPFVFLLLHLAYGIGTLWGLIIGPFYKRKNRK